MTDYYGEIESERMKTTNSGLASLYGKCGSKIARLAVNLHAFSDPTNAIISGETVKKAIILNKFFLNQTKILFAQSQALSGEIAPKLAQIVQISKQVGGINSRHLQRNCRAFKKDDPTQLRAWFKQLEKMGKGRCKGNGNRLTFEAF